MRPPPTPRSESKQDLGFERKPMYRWFYSEHSRKMIGKGLNDFLGDDDTSIANVDMLEIQAALIAPEIRSYTDEDEIWIDYIADLGDGWNSTYTMARLLAEEGRNFVSQGGSFPTQRGKLLLMGGDQVYPAATREEYRNRMQGPYQSALPWVAPHKEFRADLALSKDLDRTMLSRDLLAAFEAEKITLSQEATEGGGWLIIDGVQTYTVEREDESLKVCVDKHPHLFVIPGSNDWYDGLGSFTRLFCQGRWIGGWKTYQSRSYFALKLPHNWWVWGTDVQLASDIDRPQREYFETIARNEMQAGDRIILCTAEPTWVFSATDGPTAYENLKFFENSIIRKHGGILTVALAGDLHHYCRYEAPNPDDQGEKRHRITAGGGGAFLYGTGDMPETLLLDEGEAEEPVRYVQAEDATFPSKSTSRRLSFGGLLFPFKNWRFSLLFGGLYFQFTWLLKSAKNTGEPFLKQISNVDNFWCVLVDIFPIVVDNQSSFIFIVTLIGSLFAACSARTWCGRIILYRFSINTLLIIYSLAEATEVATTGKTH